MVCSPFGTRLHTAKQIEIIPLNISEAGSQVDLRGTRAINQDKRSGLGISMIYGPARCYLLVVSRSQTQGNFLRASPVRTEEIKDGFNYTRKRRRTEIYHCVDTVGACPRSAVEKQTDTGTTGKQEDSPLMSHSNNPAVPIDGLRLGICSILIQD